MNFKKFWEVIEFVEMSFQKNNLQEPIQNIQNMLNQYRQNRNQAFVSNISSFRNEFKNRQNILFPENWDIENVSIFLKIGANRFVGKDAVSELEKNFAGFPQSPDSAFNLFQNYFNEINGFRNKISQIYGGVSGWQNLEIDIPVAEGETAFQIGFKNEAEIKTIEDLRKGADDWLKIINAFSRLQEPVSASTKIVEVRKGSLLLVLVKTTGIVVMLAKAVQEVQKILENNLKLKKIANDLKAFDLGKDNPSSSLEMKAIKQLEAKLDELSERYYSDHPELKESNSGDVKSYVAKALQIMAEFFEKGGNVLFLKNEQIFKDKNTVALFEEIEKTDLRIAEIKLQLPPSGEEPQKDPGDQKNP